MSITVSAGRTRIPASALSASVPMPELCRLRFRFDWADGLQGADGKIEFVHGAVVLASVDLAQYGFTSIDMIIRGLDPSHEILCDFQLTGVPVSFPVNAGLGVEAVGTLELLTFESIQDPVGARSQLALAARDVSERLGLRGVYMRGERRERFAHRVLGAIEQRQPYSVVRLGDGEGRILGAGATFSAAEVLTQVLYYHFGPRSVELNRDRDRDWVLTTSAILRDMLQQACKGADEIGLPVWDFFRGIEETCTSGMVAYSDAMFYALSLDPHWKDEDRIGTNVFQQLAETPDFFQAVTRKADRIVLVGPWDLTSQLQSALSPKALSFIEVPHHHTWGDGDGFGQYPFLCSAVDKRIASLGDLRGSVFLIGAGLYGKHYANLAKKQGAVALDIGSVFDSWGGKGLPYAVRNPRLGLDKLT
ncbi:conserved hypothetical protein [Oceanicaulis sp. 350]|nr:conserved hypothetical protein [Oceanicaulis sp. 350]